MRKIPIMMDIHTGKRDVLAVLSALDREHLEVLGVATVGPVAEQLKIHEDERLQVCFSKAHVALAWGAERPLLGTFPGDDGSSKESPHRGKCLFAHYERILSSAEDEVTIITTGPVTNLASLFLAKPRLREKVKALVITGGAVERGDATSAAETMVHMDPEALSVLLKMKMAIVMLPLELGKMNKIDKEKLLAVHASGAHGDTWRHYVEQAFATTARQETLLAGLCAVNYASQPASFRGRAYHVTVDTSDGLTRGATIVDKYKTLRREANVHWLEHGRCSAVVER